MLHIRFMVATPQLGLRLGVPFGTLFITIFSFLLPTLLFQMWLLTSWFLTLTLGIWTSSLIFLISRLFKLFHRLLRFIVSATTSWGGLQPGKETAPLKMFTDFSVLKCRSGCHSQELGASSNRPIQSSTEHGSSKIFLLSSRLLHGG